MANSTEPIYLTNGTIDLSDFNPADRKLNLLSFQEHLMFNAIPIASFNSIDGSGLPQNGGRYTLHILHMTIPKGMKRIDILDGDYIHNNDLIKLNSLATIKAGITLIADEILAFPLVGGQDVSFSNHIDHPDDNNSEIDSIRPRKIGVKTPCAKILKTNKGNEPIFTRWESDVADHSDIDQRKQGLWYYEKVVDEHDKPKDFYTLELFDDGKTAFDYDYLIASMPNHIICYIALERDKSYEFFNEEAYPIIAIDKLIYLDGPDIFIGTPKL